MPISTNRLHTGGGPMGRKRLTVHGREEKRIVAWEAHSLYRGVPMNGPCIVDLFMFWPDKRKRDVDNIKGYIDSLTGILWTDDSLIMDLNLKKRVDPENPRVEIKVYAFKETL
jgi:Holliday junction resolvase RusA-like endonuclease